MREITIGRSPQCDIYLDESCQYASNQHGSIYFDGFQLMYMDTSRNGTMVNNQKVHNCTVPISRGDSILIAGMYPLKWSLIDSYFPPQRQAQPTMPIGQPMAQPVQMVSMPQPQAEPVPQAVAVQQPQQVDDVPYRYGSEAQPNLSKWSWGAFVFGWLWGVFNGCWWMLLISIGLFICYLIPFVNFLAPFLSLGVYIYYGVKGTEWAWNNKAWSSVLSFEQTQRSWNTVGLVFFIIGLLILVFGVIFFFSTILALLSSL